VRSLSSLMTLCFVGLILGCGGNDSDSSADAPEEQFTESGLKWRPAESLPSVDEHVSGDEGRIEIAGPEGWQRLGDNPKYVARFAEQEGSQPPWITVLADSSPLPILGDLKEEAAGGKPEAIEKYREVLEGELKKLPNPRIQEPCKPLMLGETVFLRHVRLRSGAGVPLVVQSLQTVQGGRLYTVELTCKIEGDNPSDYAPSLTTYRDAAYAVAANLRFVNREPPAETPAEDKPAEAQAETP
jgi:hypothetical protein